MRNSEPYAGWWHERNPKNPTALMRIGTQVHLLLFEPGEFERTYVLCPTDRSGGKLPKSTKENKAIWEDFEKSLEPHQELIEPEDLDLVQDIAKSLIEHPLVSSVLEKALFFEPSVFWEDKKSGLLCKARPDILVTETGSLFDLKVTGDCRPRAFAAAVEDQAYQIQLAHYTQGLNAHGIEIERQGFIVVERDEPRGIETYLLPTEEKKSAHSEWRDLLDRYAECESTGVWPKYSVGFKEIYRPTWAQKK